ncbi:hypothetical protein ACHAW5_005773 [Stephanodiscus triporus]|uniref:Uncharacterized protein n=1 Tax=Stephanodiscus triporus TaxID=2934178 RepID=A0ABD3MBH6_9STRA
MSNIIKDTNKEEGAASNPSLNKNAVTDMTEDMHGSIINIAQRAFHVPVNGGSKVYQTIADLIRVEFDKEYEDGRGGNEYFGRGTTMGGGEGYSANGRGGNESSGRATGNASGCKQISSGGWNCMVRDAFGSSVTHRMKTYIKKFQVT